MSFRGDFSSLDDHSELPIEPREGQWWTGSQQRSSFVLETLSCTCIRTQFIGSCLLLWPVALHFFEFHLATDRVLLTRASSCVPFCLDSNERIQSTVLVSLVFSPLLQFKHPNIELCEPLILVNLCTHIHPVVNFLESFFFSLRQTPARGR